MIEIYKITIASIMTRIVDTAPGLSVTSVITQFIIVISSYDN